MSDAPPQVNMTDEIEYYYSLLGQGGQEDRFGIYWHLVNALTHNEEELYDRYGKELVRQFHSTSFWTNRDLRFFEACPLLSPLKTIFQPVHRISEAVEEGSNNDLIAPFLIDKVHSTLGYFVSRPRKHVSEFSYPADIKHILRCLINNLVAAHEREYYFGFMSTRTIFVVSSSQGAMEHQTIDKVHGGKTVKVRNVRLEDLSNTDGLKSLNCCFAYGLLPERSRNANYRRLLVEQQRHDWRRLWLVLRAIRFALRLRQMDSEISSLERYLIQYATVAQQPTDWRVNIRGHPAELVNIRRHPALWELRDRCNFIVTLHETIHSRPIIPISCSVLGLPPNWPKHYTVLTTQLSRCLFFNGHAQCAPYIDGIDHIVRLLRNVYVHYEQLEIFLKRKKPALNLENLIFGKYPTIFVRLSEYARSRSLM